MENLSVGYSGRNNWITSIDLECFRGRLIDSHWTIELNLDQPVLNAEKIQITITEDLMIFAITDDFFRNTFYLRFSNLFMISSNSGDVISDLADWKNSARFSGN